MANITLRLPDDLHDKMKKYKTIKWNQLIREYIMQQLKLIEEADYRVYALQQLSKAESAEDLFEF